MKKLLLSLLLVSIFTISFSSCRETTGDKVEDSVEEVADEVEDAVD